jgi:hypothetical protein
MWGRREKLGGFCLRKLKYREYFEGLATDRSIISCGTLKNQVWDFSTGLMWLEVGKIGGLV